MHSSPRIAKILEQLANQRGAMMEFRMKNGNHGARLLAYVTGVSVANLNRDGVAGRTEGRLSVTVTRQSRGVCLWQAFG